MYYNDAAVFCICRELKTEKGSRRKSHPRDDDRCDARGKQDAHNTSASGAFPRAAAALRLPLRRSSHTPAPLPKAMPFVVALLGNEARPYARVTEEELVALAEERGVEITVR